jgi:hypothetical protein
MQNPVGINWGIMHVEERFGRATAHRMFFVYSLCRPSYPAKTVLRENLDRENRINPLLREQRNVMQVRIAGLKSDPT